MVYEFKLTVDTENDLVEALITENGTNLRLNNSPSNFYSDCHENIINIITSDRVKLERLVELIVIDHNTSFSTFCHENEIEIPEIPSEE